MDNVKAFCAQQGDPYSVDLAVTGGDSGTTDDPKFALLHWFEDLVLKEVEKSVGEGGRFAGYTPVIQVTMQGHMQRIQVCSGIARSVVGYGSLNQLKCLK